MANMSYCRFRNTLGDLRDCVSALDTVSTGDELLSYEEARAAKAMLQVCQEYIDTYQAVFDED